MAMKALRGMVNGAMNELSSAVSGNRPAASAPASSAAATREHVMAVKRDYISQPRLSKSHRQHQHHHCRSDATSALVLAQTRLSVSRWPRLAERRRVRSQLRFHSRRATPHTCHAHDEIPLVVTGAEPRAGDPSAACRNPAALSLASENSC